MPAPAAPAVLLLLLLLLLLTAFPPLQCDFAVLAGPKMSVPGSCWLKSLGAKPFHRPGDVTCCPEGMKCEKKGKR